jgi:hypothetical protein
MAYTNQDLINIRELITAGEGKAQVDGKLIEYRDLDDLIRIEKLIIKSLASQATPAKKRRSSFLGAHMRTQLNRGLD